jgi:hypothetical protein
MGDSEVIGQFADQEEAPTSTSLGVGLPDRRLTVTAVAHLRPEQGAVQEQSDAELPSRRHSVEQGIGGEFRDAQPYVVLAVAEVPLNEGGEGELPGGAYRSARSGEASLP